MLQTLNTSLKGRIITVKLINGDEIIARLVDLAPTSITITNPLSLVMVASEEDAQGIVAFSPWVLATKEDQKIELEMTKLFFYSVARDDAASQYAAAIGEPINLVENKSPSPRGAVSATPKRGARR